MSQPHEVYIGDKPPPPDQGKLWKKPIDIQPPDVENITGELLYVFYKDSWNLVYDVGDVGEMIEILSLFGDVKITKSSGNEYFCCHMPKNRGALWYFQSKKSLNEALDGLIKKAVDLKVINWRV